MMDYHSVSGIKKEFRRMRSRRFFDDPDFRAHPVRGAIRRVQWRLHWYLHSDRSVVVTNWHGGLSVELPHSGSGAQIFYRRYSSLPGVRATMAAVRPGTTVLDIGA